MIHSAPSLAVPVATPSFVAMTNHPVSTDPAVEKVDDPTSRDVLNGRGIKIQNHEGNVIYRKLVVTNKEHYAICHKNDKIKISRSIVNVVRREGGRFLERKAVNGPWTDVGDKAAIKKTSQALREGQNNIKHRVSMDSITSVSSDGSNTVEEVPEEAYLGYSSQVLKALVGGNGVPMRNSLQRSTERPAPALIGEAPASPQPMIHAPFSLNPVVPDAPTSCEEYNGTEKPPLLRNTTSSCSFKARIARDVHAHNVLASSMISNSDISEFGGGSTEVEHTDTEAHHVHFVESGPSPPHRRKWDSIHSVLSNAFKEKASFMSVMSSEINDLITGEWADDLDAVADGFNFDATEEDCSPEHPSETAQGNKHVKFQEDPKKPFPVRGSIIRKHAAGLPSVIDGDALSSSHDAGISTLSLMSVSDGVEGDLDACDMPDLMRAVSVNMDNMSLSG